MSIPKHYKQGLDIKNIFLIYVSMGKGASYEKVAKRLEKDGIMNELTGRRYSNSAIWQAFWRYVIHNMDEAKPIYANYVLLFGDRLDDEDFLYLVSKHAKTLYKKWQYARVLDKYPQLPDCRDY